MFEFNMDIDNSIRLGMQEEAFYKILEQVKNNFDGEIRGSNLERLSAQEGYNVDDDLIIFIESHGCKIY